MSDHFDTDDSRTDLCDLYLFASQRNLCIRQIGIMTRQLSTRSIPQSAVGRAGWPRWPRIGGIR